MDHIFHADSTLPDSQLGTQVTFRALTELDRPHLVSCIQNDPDHRAWLLPEFFFYPDSMTLVAGDAQGPVLFLRQKSVLGTDLALFIQFAHAGWRRTVNVLYHGFPVVRDTARRAGFQRIVFDSTSRPLVRLLQKRFGFQPWVDANHPAPNHYVLEIGY